MSLDPATCSRIERAVDHLLAPLRRDDSGYEVPINITQIARNAGLVVQVFEHGIAGVARPNTNGAPVSGYLDFTEGFIAIDGRENRARQRFTVAHELAHYALDWHRELYRDTGHVVLAYADDDADALANRITITGDSDAREELRDRAEAEADHFAGRILMPPHEVDKAVARLGASVPLLAREFDVSVPAMRINMAGYLAPGTAPRGHHVPTSGAE